MSDSAQNDFGAFLRDASKYVLAALIGVAGWNVSAVINHGERIRSLEIQMDPATGNRYTRADSVIDANALNGRLRDIERRLGALEK